MARLHPRPSNAAAAPTKASPLQCESRRASGLRALPIACHALILKGAGTEPADRTRSDLDSKGGVMLFGILKDLLRDSVFSIKDRARRVQDDPRASSPAPSEADLRRTLELLPNSAQAHTDLGVALKNAERPAEAEAVFRRALDLHGNNVVALYNLGIVLAETHRP